jgi:hypothetical protein
VKVRALALALVALPLLGMGMLGGGSDGPPERNYQVTFVDRDGTRVEAGWVTAGGEMALTGELGRGTLRIPFDEIQRVEFGADDRDDAVAHVMLREGQAVDVKVRSSIAFSGRTALGVYRVRARDLKSIEFAKP